MNNNNTKLVNALLKGEDISEIFRAEVEKAINTVLEAELTGFLNYEKHSVEGYNTGNSRMEVIQKQYTVSMGNYQ